MKNKNSHLANSATKAKNSIKNEIDNRKIYNIVDNLILEVTESDFITIFRYDKEKYSLRTYNEDDNQIEISMARPVGLLGQCFLTKKSAIYNHIASEKHYVIDIDNPSKLKIRSQLIMPIVRNDELIAIVRVSRSLGNNKQYTRKETDIITSLFEFLLEILDILDKPSVAVHHLGTNTNIIDKDIDEIQSKSVNDDINSSMLFLSNAVHDIRTPANSLYGFLDILEEQIDDKRLKGFVASAKESAEFINSITDSILEQVKETQEINSNKPEPINSIAFFSHIGNMFSGNMSKKEIYYLVHISPNIPKEIIVDKVKLKRVIINLIGNAYKFTPTKHKIDFRVNYLEDTQKLQIEVIDNGLGIDKSRQEVIFESFKQAEEDTSKHFGGTGLGLAISSQYVSGLGGKLELDSSLGEGSRFYFTIPIKITDKTPSQKRFAYINKKITLLTDNLLCIDAANIYKYLVELGMPKDNIVISNTLDVDTTHLFCFQHKLFPEVLEISKEFDMKVTIIEEELFSLSKDSRYTDYTIISENTYYGDVVHYKISTKNRTKILIADDNKINIILLKAMLETEYCEVFEATDGVKAFDMFRDAYGDNQPFDLIFLDEHMPNLKGSELILKIRNLEKEENIKPIFAISITGDPMIEDSQGSMYDMRVNKPFKRQDIIDAVASLNPNS